MRRTWSQVAVARALLANPSPDAFHWGYDLAKRADIKSGVLYPILARMEGAGWLTSSWEDPQGSYPRRRVYQVTEDGRREMTALVEGSRW
jgi:PadR family transcriptional regulator, regulatory protein PadR